MRDLQAKQDEVDSPMTHVEIFNEVMGKRAKYRKCQKYQRKFKSSTSHGDIEELYEDLVSTKMKLAVAN